MHKLEKDVRDAGEKYLAAKKEFEAAKAAAVSAGFKVFVQNDGEKDSLVVSGGPEPVVVVDSVKVVDARAVSAKAETKVVS